MSRSPSSAYRSENDELRREAGWIRRQSLRVLVDMSPGINLFPDLRLVDNIKEEYEASLAAIDHVLAKMAILGARDLIVSLHRQPENNYTGAQTQTDFDKTMRQICKDAEARRITVHLRMSPGKPPWGLQAAVDFLERVAADNLRLAPSVAMLLADQTDPTKAADIVRNKVDLWLVAASEHDVAGRLWNTHAGITKFGRKNDMAAILGIVADKPTILDAVYPDKDAEYLDARALSRLVTEGTTSKPQEYVNGSCIDRARRSQLTGHGCEHAPISSDTGVRSHIHCTRWHAHLPANCAPVWPGLGRTDLTNS